MPRGETRNQKDDWKRTDVLGEAKSRIGDNQETGKKEGIVITLCPTKTEN